MKISSGTLQSKSLQEASPTLVGKEDYKTETSVLYSYKDSALPASSAIKNGETTNLLVVQLKMERLLNLTINLFLKNSLLKTLTK